MSLFGNVFSSKSNYPAIDASSIAASRVAKVKAQLRTANQSNADVSRFCTTVQDRDVVITPSAKLEKEVHEIIEKVVHH